MHSPADWIHATCVTRTASPRQVHSCCTGPSSQGGASQAPEDPTDTDSIASSPTAVPRADAKRGKGASVGPKPKRRKGKQARYLVLKPLGTVLQCMCNSSCCFYKMPSESMLPMLPCSSVFRRSNISLYARCLSQTVHRLSGNAAS